MRNSIIIHSLLLLIAFFYYFEVDKKDIDPDKPYRVVVDFTFKESSLNKYAKADVGAAKPKSDEVKAVEQNTVEEVKPTAPTEEVKIETPVKVATPTPPVTTTTTATESPVKIETSDIKIDAPEPDRVPVKEKPAEPSKPAGGSTSSDTPKSGGSTGPSSTSGTGPGKGNTGSGPGADKGKDSDSGAGDAPGKGTGDFDESGNGVFGRKVIFRNTAGLPMNKSGKLYFKVCINRAGRITFIEIDEKKSTIKDREFQKKALSGVKGYLYEPDPKAPAEQCGVLSYIIENNAALKIR